MLNVKFALKLSSSIFFLKHKNKKHLFEKGIISYLKIILGNEVTVRVFTFTAGGPWF